MTRTGFMNLQEFGKHFVNRKLTTNREKVDFRNVTQYKFTKDDIGIMYIKFTYNEDELWKQVNLKKRGITAVNFIVLNEKYSESKPISKAKFDDVQSLLPYIPPKYHPFLITFRLIKKL